MEVCTEQEIARKRRIAMEKLQAKKMQFSKKPNVTSNIEKLGNIEINNSPVNNDTRKFMQSIQQNKPVGGWSKNQQPTSPYEKGSAYKSITSDLNSNNKNSLAPIFVKTVQCSCFVIGEARFAVKTSEYHSKAVDVFKTIPSKSYDADTKLWSFSLGDYDLIQQRFENLKPNILIDTIPKNVLKVCKSPIADLEYSCLESIEPKLSNALLSFQKEGVCFGISKHGRVLIADEMGLGKTYQALAIADFYKEDWPVLICTSASTRDSWLQHIRDLLPKIPCHSVMSLNSKQDYIGDAKILVSSYAMMEKQSENLLEKQFGVLIMDESHSLKSHKAKCTNVADRLARAAKRIILLSGTPALSRPAELFTQIQMLDRSFYSFKDYTIRYCEAKQTAFGWDTSGKSNLEELNVILKKKFMIRRKKVDVLPQLADKNREVVMLDQLLIGSSLASETELEEYAKGYSTLKGKQREEILLKYFTKTATIKVKAVCCYLKNLLKEDNKFIIFAYHQVMMDAICDLLDKKRVDYIRIDGSTRNDLRPDFIKRFQTKSSCKVAVLSLKACNTGITLTAAQLILFAELDWNPSTMVQAESRAHRIGQEGSVVCRYLLAANTADDIIWQMLKTKQETLNKAGLFCDNIHNGEFSLATDSSSPKIDKYYSKTVSKNRGKNVEKIVRKGEKHLEIDEDNMEIDQANNSKSNLNSSNADEFKNLLDEDDDDFDNLMF